LAKKNRLTIIGAGPVGLACAYYAQKKGLDFELFEASNSYGGNCKTFEVDGFYFDSGAHRLHDKIEKVSEDWKSILGEDMLSIEKPSQIIDQHRKFDFPLSPLNLLANLSLKEIIISGIQFLFYRKKSDSFSERAKCNYTPILADKFLLNYSRKLWGVNPDELLPEVSGGRLNGLNFSTVFKELLFGKSKKTEHLDGRFYYPKKGIQQLMDNIVEAVSDNIFYDKPLQSIELSEGRIQKAEIGGESKQVDYVINSAPIHLLLGAEKPDLRHLILMTICLDRDPIGDVATYYFPDNRYKFTRVVEPRVRSEFMAPEGKTSLMVEIPVSDFKLVNKNELKVEVLEQLVEANFFTDKQIIDVTFFDLPNAYPVLSVNNKIKVDKMLTELEKIDNLKTFGRSGGFSYVHLHDIFKFAKNCIEDYAKFS